MSQNYYGNNPSYYRSHQYAHQFNLPDSAMNNRKMPVYTSQMPQGNDPFMPSHKKHFQRAGYRSIIAQEQLINHQPQQQTNSPAKNKDYYRNLSIEDIEGASTNTLISQALKNRIKAKEHYLRRQKQQKMQQNANSIHFTQQSMMQQQALKRFKPNNNKDNYHSNNRRITKTEGNGQYQSPRLQNQEGNTKISQYKRQIEQAERDLQELQRKLNVAKQGFDRDTKDNKTSIQQKRYKQERQLTNHNKLVLPKIINQQQTINVKSNEQRKEISQLRKRSQTQPNQNQKYIYPSSDKIKQHKNYQQMLEQSRIRRQQIRKMNPTYLSYGTYATNNSSKRVYL